VEIKPGSGKFVSIPNPLTPEEVGVLISGLNVGGHHAVSLTGGEPLLYPDFIRELIPHLHGAHRGVYLETNGTLVEELKAAVDLVDVISMDIKLPSTTGMAPFWETHARFLEVARKKEVILKAVVSGKTPAEEVLAAAELARTAGTVLVLQPITGSVSGEQPTPAELLKLQAKALEVARDVRVIPQVHRLCGML
jgi:organic radical activating enzyme